MNRFVNEFFDLSISFKLADVKDNDKKTPLFTSVSKENYYLENIMHQYSITLTFFF